RETRTDGEKELGRVRRRLHAEDGGPVAIGAVIWSSEK
ncbi:hypothetical protein A2U01_0114479, partial [Trifolium medium]|nr:hypothetical protein [Trifolium medium]